MKKLYLHSTAMSVAAMLGAAATTVPAMAQDIGALEARVAELEAEAESSRLSFTTGDDTTIELYGFVRFEAFYDSDFEQGDLSLTGSLNTLTPTTGTFDTSVRVSRIGVRATSETGIGTIVGQLEYDLFGSGGTAELRLRHANVSVGGFTIGQTWTNFMPIGQYPTSADFNGPVGVTFARVPQVRYTGNAGDLTYSVSIEQATGQSDDPNFTAALQYSTDAYSVRIAGIVGTQQDGIGGEDDIAGVTLSATAALWDGGHLGATYLNGDGLGFLAIGGGDTLVGGAANNVEGYTIEARHDFGQFNVGAVYGYEEYEAGIAATSINQLETIHVNAFWTPTDNFSVGVEYINGSRTDFTGAELEADRIGASVTFTF